VLVGVAAGAVFEAADYDGPYWGARLFYIVLGLAALAAFPYSLVRLRRRRAARIRYRSISAMRR
jgi:hypothetical protein